MFVEVHILQNFALSNLNRDDTGAPKDCDFGGYRRARISSQCLKRAIRDHFREHELLSKENLACRTKQLVGLLAERLEALGRDRAAARAVGSAALTHIGFTVKEQEKQKTEYLLFVGEEEIQALAMGCERNWEQLEAYASGAAPADAGSGKKGKKKEGEVDKQLAEELAACLSGSQTVDLALFGRMIANRPGDNIDAASQVAHAFSTHRVSMEFDFYTAIDDFQDPEAEATSGAGMMGTVQYNASCYYRYANLSLAQLMKNLGDDEELARKAVRAFLAASIAAVPSGKQNATAAQNPPSLVLVVVRERGLWSLANAFINPVRPGSDGDLISKSVAALIGYWNDLTDLYGRDGISYAGAISTEKGEFSGVNRAANLGSLLDGALAQMQFPVVKREG